MRLATSSTVARLSLMPSDMMDCDLIRLMLCTCKRIRPCSGLSLSTLFLRCCGTSPFAIVMAGPLQGSTVVFRFVLFLQAVGFRESVPRPAFEVSSAITCALLGYRSEQVCFWSLFFNAASICDTPGAAHASMQKNQRKASTSQSVAPVPRAAQPLEDICRLS